ncbi:MAG: hypothetical protein IPJ13_11020 [Saprospiraceae bacterium]|nr:hypothetical protein [Saprospiraceae bacterium]
MKPGKDDLIYGGNTVNWRKAANTIKLKLLNQMRKVKDVKMTLHCYYQNLRV